MTLISHKKFAINQDNNGFNYCENQINNFYAQTSLLSTRVEFKSSKELSSDDSEDDGDNMSIQKLKSKYHVLIPGVSYENGNNSYSNGLAVNGKLKLNLKQNNQEYCKKNDGNDLGEPKHVLYSRDNVILEWKKISKIGSGLINLGNTCFMNSVLQSLAYCPPFVNYLNSVKDDHSNKCRSNFCMICLMLKHIGLIWTQNYNGQQIVKPYYICQRLKSIAKHFTFGRQEDAHEFLRYVIDHMWRSCLSIHEHEFGIAGTSSKFDPLTKATTAINQIFGGYHRSQVLCMQCKEKSNTYDYFMDFMLDIQNVSSLEEALQKYVTPEILRNDNAYKCSKCKKSVVAKKQFTVYKAPNVATFQIKRFDCSKMFGKISKAVSYPEKLNLRPYMSEKGPPLYYKLISVLVHFGPSSNSGHYFCYVRNSNNCWYLMDDSRVSQVNLNEVLSQKAYVLFYIRLPNEIQQNRPKTTPQSTQMQVLQNTDKCFNANFKFSLNSEKLHGTTTYNNDKNEQGLRVNSNLSYNTSSNLSPAKKNNVNKTSKGNLLVPYDEEDSDADKNDSKCTANDLSKKNCLTKIDNESKLNIKNNSTNVNSSRQNLSQNEQKANGFLKETESIPILKVKATTNSWQVVESTNTKPQAQVTVANTTSNWKIIKTSTSELSTVNSKSKHNLSSISSNFSSKIENKITLINSDKGLHVKNNNISDELAMKKEKKKRKKKKKDKEKKKKRRENDSEDDNIELKWVERTKETLEMEKHEIKEVSDKRKLDQSDVVCEPCPAKKQKCLPQDIQNLNKPDILDALLKNVSRGYGDNVKSWDGGMSNLNKSISEDFNKTDSFDNDDEEYNEEFDKGKVKKIKNKQDMFDTLKCDSVKSNPFQRMQFSKYATNQNGYLSNSSYKPMKFNNKSDFKSKKYAGQNFIREKYFDKKSGKLVPLKHNSEYSPKNKNNFKPR